MTAEHSTIYPIFQGSLSLGMEAIGRTVETKGINFREKRRIRSRLLAIHKENGKVTERDLLRLSALTGVSYSIIVEIHRATRYGGRGGLKGLIRKISSKRQVNSH